MSVYKIFVLLVRINECWGWDCPHMDNCRRSYKFWVAQHAVHNSKLSSPEDTGTLLTLMSLYIFVEVSTLVGISVVSTKETKQLQTVMLELLHKHAMVVLYYWYSPLRGPSNLGRSKNCSLIPLTRYTLQLLDIDPEVRFSESSASSQLPCHYCNRCQVLRIDVHWE